MTRDEFEREFATLCGAYKKKIEDEEFLARAYWQKFKDMEAKGFLNAILKAIDSHKHFPTVYDFRQIVEYQESANQPYVPTPTPKPSLNTDGSKKSFRDIIKDCGNPKAIEAYNKFCCRGKNKPIEIGKEA